MRMFGEDLKQFMRGAASQRYSLVTYLDLFCYQPMEHRCRWVACRVFQGSGCRSSCQVLCSGCGTSSTCMEGYR